jgi:hypothetical protein
MGLMTHLCDCDLFLVGGVEINVVGAYTCSDTELELFGFLDQIRGEVSWVKGGRDEDLGLVER